MNATAFSAMLQGIASPAQTDHLCMFCCQPLCILTTQDEIVRMTKIVLRELKRLKRWQ